MMGSVCGAEGAIHAAGRRVAPVTHWALARPSSEAEHAQRSAISRIEWVAVHGSLAELQRALREPALGVVAPSVWVTSAVRNAAARDMLLLLRDHGMPVKAELLAICRGQAAASGAQRGDYMDRLLHVITSLDAPDDYLQAYLHGVVGYFLFNDGPHRLRWVLSRGGASRVNARDAHGRTAMLTLAEGLGVGVEERMPEVVATAMQALIARGADVDAQDSRGETMLMKVCEDPRCVRLLLQAHADVSLRDGRGATVSQRVRERMAPLWFFSPRRYFLRQVANMLEAAEAASQRGS